MVSRQLEKSKFDTLKGQIINQSNNTDLSIIYDIPISFNGKKYILRIAIDEYKSIISAIECVSIDFERDLNDKTQGLITKNIVISAMLELLIFQGVKSYV